MPKRSARSRSDYKKKKPAPAFEDDGNWNNGLPFKAGVSKVEFASKTHYLDIMENRTSSIDDYRIRPKEVKKDAKD